MGGKIFCMWTRSEVRQETEEAEAQPVGEVSPRPASSSQAVASLLVQESSGPDSYTSYT